MVKAKRIERVAALSKLLADHPYRLFSFSYFLSFLYFATVSSFCFVNFLTILFFHHRFG